MRITNEEPKTLKIYKFIISDTSNYNSDVEVKYGLDNGELFDDIKIVAEYSLDKGKINE